MNLASRNTRTALAGLLAGLPGASAPGISPPADGTRPGRRHSNLRAEIARHNIGFVIVDSYGPASARGRDGRPAIRMMNALRSFAPATRLVVAHVSKASAESKWAEPPLRQRLRDQPGRSVWEVRRSERWRREPQHRALPPQGESGAALLPPLGLKLAFDGGTISLGIARPRLSQPDLLKRASLAFRLRRPSWPAGPGARLISSKRWAPQRIRSRGLSDDCGMTEG